MKRVVLFRFHKKPLVCKNRINILKKFNPHMKIFGLFGGEDKYFEKIRKILRNDLEHIYLIKGKSAEWKWMHSDLAVRMWFSDYGRKLDFDILHIIEWDLLVFDSLKKVYSHIPDNALGLTGLTKLKNVESKWNWTSKEPWRSRWLKMLEFVKEEYGYNLEPYASLGPGTALPRKFLEMYLKVTVPELCNDELRLPLFAQILGYKLYDTGFYNKWLDKEEQKYFNSLPVELKNSDIKSELARPGGRRVFHPYRKIFDIDVINSYRL